MKQETPLSQTPRLTQNTWEAISKQAGPDNNFGDEAGIVHEPALMPDPKHKKPNIHAIHLRMHA